MNNQFKKSTRMWWRLIQLNESVPWSRLSCADRLNVSILHLLFLRTIVPKQKSLVQWKFRKEPFHEISFRATFRGKAYFYDGRKLIITVEGEIAGVSHVGESMPESYKIEGLIYVPAFRALSKSIAMQCESELSDYHKDQERELKVARARAVLLQQHEQRKATKIFAELISVDD